MYIIIFAIDAVISIVTISRFAYIYLSVLRLD